jgi:hypothetical protein
MAGNSNPTLEQRRRKRRFQSRRLGRYKAAIAAISGMVATDMCWHRKDMHPEFAIIDDVRKP